MTAENKKNNTVNVLVPVSSIIASIASLFYTAIHVIQLLM